MASFHLSVKTVQRSAGRSATAAAAYRHAERIACDREGRVHDYRAKQGVEHSFIVAPEDAPAWAHDRAALWNAAEARETRSNSVTAREWELALPHELDASGRRLLVEGFARELVSRYGVAADVAIHAPHREGDQRNWHAHVLTTTRALGRDGLTDKTRALDAKATGGPEIAHMRERWAVLQNHALERAHVAERVDHRTLAVQRDEARTLGHEAQADNLDRAPEVKLGPVVSGIERKEERAAQREERAYVPLTERGTQVHEARAARSLLAELTRVREALREELRQRAEQVRERAEAARTTYAHAREEGADTIRAGLAALRAAAQRQGIGLERGQGQERAASHEGIRERLTSVLGRGQEAGQGRGHDPAQQEREASRERIREQLGRVIAKDAPGHAQDAHQAQERPAAGLSAHGLDRQGQDQGQERSLGREAIRERLEALRDHAKPAALKQQEPGHEHGREGRAHEERGHEGQAHGGRTHGGRTHGEETDPINARLRALLARERSAPERHGPVPRVLERARDEPAYAPSFRSPQEAQAFREEMERRFDPGTLQRLGRGEERALAEVAGNRLDGLCLARAYLDSRGEPERSEARMSLADRIVDAQHDARRERQAHEQDGHEWGL